ncbi:MAG: response regulator [Saprospiraceae bacterium]|nr:response regulator [Saprospiraceae bacterium]MCB0625051.1 response regulator [Saprospiraceae bacterium]MCB0677479.1 response regulator [Saprospiraceae bacterium]
MHLLYIDDDEVDLLVFQRLAGKMNQFTYDLAENFSQALALMKTHSYDLVLSDFFLGEGRQATDLLPHLGQTPLVIVSGQAEVAPLDQAVEQGVKGYYFKPLSIESLAILLTTPERAARAGLKTDWKELDFDFSYLDELEVDQAFRLQVLGLFREMTPLALEKTRELLPDNQWEAIQAIVHRSKSNLRYLGLHALLDLADEIEDDCGRPYRHHLLPGKVAHWLTGMERALEKTQELLHTTNR